MQYVKALLGIALMLGSYALAAWAASREDWLPAAVIILYLFGSSRLFDPEV